MVCGAAEICVSWGRQLLPALPDFGPEHPNSHLRDDSPPPTITEHFATTCGSSRAVPAGSAGWLSSALTEQPPGELLAAHGAAVRPGTCARVSLMPWAHLLQKGARWGERASRRRRLRSWRAPSAGCMPLRAVSWARAAPTAEASALDRCLKSGVPRRSHPCHMRRIGPVQHPKGHMAVL